MRVARPDGSWAEPDATLERRADGSIGPKASVADVSFSAGGDGGGLLKLAEDGRWLSLGWPGSLPKPVLEGASATYAEVLPGVDLRMTATVEGVRQVLVVKSAGAAANPELERIEFSLKTQGLTVATRAGGGLAAMDEDGNAVFRSPAARMWDSAGDTAGTGTTTMSLAAVDDEPVVDGHGETSAEPADGPGNGDASAVLPVELTDDAVAVVPDAGLLSGENTVYPLYIDPDVGLDESERTVLSSDGDTFYNFSGDDGEGVGLCGTYVTGGYAYYCGSGYRQRMYFEFGSAKLAGKQVLDATFRVTELFSMSCEKTVVDLVRTGNISSATNWPGPTANWDVMGDQRVAAGRGTACSPSQPDAPVEFNDDAAKSYQNLTHTVKVFADGGFSRLTLMLKAHDEGDPNGWKRFDDDATLAVKFVGLPAVPTYPGIAVGKGVKCSTKSADPDVIADRNPMLTARPQTAAGGEGGAHLRAHFYVQRKQADGTWVLVTEPVRPQPSTVIDNAQVKAETPIILAENGTYRMAAFTQSLYNDDKSYLQSSSTVTTKNWCYFTVDLHSPKPPVVTFGGPYSECDDVCAAAGGPGIKGRFTFSPAAGDVNDYYQYKLSKSASWSERIAGNTVATWVTPRVAGTEQLEVRAGDSAGEGDSKFVEFKVAEGQPAVGRWHFNDYTPDPTTTETSATDTATEGTRHTMSLRGAGAGWSLLARRGELDYSLWLNGDPADATRQSGYAATSEAVVDARFSFTVSAWANLSDASANRTVISQTGSDNSNFTLYYSSGVQRWVFLWSWYENGVRKYESVSASATGVPLNAWVHVAGSYDAGSRSIRLYVNGQPQGSPVFLPSMSQATVAGGALQVGRVAFTPGGTYQNYMSGRVDEMAVWQRLLTDEDVATEAHLLDENGDAYTELVADWNPDGAVAGTGPLADTFSGYKRSLKLSNGASLDGKAIVLDGANDTATTAGPVVDDSGSFTVTTAVELNSEVMAAQSNDYVAQVVGQRGTDGSSWGLWFEKTRNELDLETDKQVPVGKWYFGRLNAAGAWTAVVSDVPTTVTPNSVTRLTGVFDASAGTISLYIGANQNGPDLAYTAVAGSGDFAVGTGFVDSAWGHYLGGRITRIRIWAGAMSEQQVGAIVGGTDD